MTVSVSGVHRARIPGEAHERMSSPVRVASTGFRFGGPWTASTDWSMGPGQTDRRPQRETVAAVGSGCSRR